MSNNDEHRKIFGLLVPDIQNPFYVEVIQGVEEYAFSKDILLIISTFTQSKAKENLYLKILKEEKVAGLILAPYDESDEDVRALIKSGFPTVCIDRVVSDVNVDIIQVDNELGAFEAVEYLISRRHERIGFIGGLPSIPTSQQRKDGYIKALGNHNLKVDENLIRFGDSKLQSAKIITEELLKLIEPPTAIFSGNNLITLGVLETIHSLNLSIPEDVAIIGFDDMPWSISLNPPLTAVEQPGYDIGKRAAERLYLKITDPEHLPAKITLKAKLIKRNSC